MPATAEDLIFAVKLGDIDLLEHILSDPDSDVNAARDDGWTALMSAAAEQQLTALKFLLSKGADADARDNEGNTAVNIALKLRNRAILELLPSDGIDYSHLPVRTPPLCIYDSMESSDGYGSTEEYEYGSYDDPRYDMGAYLEEEAAGDDSQGTAARYNSIGGATRYSSRAAAEGADDIDGIASPTAIEAARDSLDKPGSDDEATISSVMAASEVGDWMSLEQLLYFGKLRDINAQNERGWTALHVAASNGRLDHLENILSLHEGDSEQGGRVSPLHGDYHSQKEESMEATTSTTSTSKPSIMDSNRKDANEGKDEAVGDEIDVDVDVASSLLSEKIPFSQFDELSQTNYSECITVLLKAGADPNGVNADTGVTPLMLAVQMGNLECVRELLNYQAEVFVHDKSGKTARDYASLQGNTDCIELIDESLGKLQEPRPLARIKTPSGSKEENLKEFNSQSSSPLPPPSTGWTPQIYGAAPERPRPAPQAERVEEQAIPEDSPPSSPAPAPAGAPAWIPQLPGAPQMIIPAPQAVMLEEHAVPEAPPPLAEALPASPPAPAPVVRIIPAPAANYVERPRLHERWLIPSTHLMTLYALGRGSYGRVDACMWKGARVAVKRLILSEESERVKAALLARVRAEAELLATLKHPHIVSFMGITDNNPPDIVMEVCSDSLFNVLRCARGNPQIGQKITWRRRLSMLRDAASGMVYLHELSPPVLHRDLKSPNLLLTFEGVDWKVKISDLGLSRESILDLNPDVDKVGSPGSKDGSVKSTTSTQESINELRNPRWLAPEVMDGRKWVAPSDVYSFGVIMWEMVTWKMPWEGLPEVAVRGF